VRIVDLPDGSFALWPDPKLVRQRRLLAGLLSFLVVGSGVAFIAVGVGVPIRGDFSTHVKGDFVPGA